jgi:hypothetical protein
MRPGSIEKKSVAFRFINGDNGADILSQKELFGDLVADIGYLSPRSVYIEAGTNTEDIYTKVSNELEDQISYFAKPVNGSKGRGVGLFDNIYDLSVSVSNNKEDYLVQSDETPQEDWRYILHRDANNPNRIWRIGYKKIRPQVLGDGLSTIEKLVGKSSDIPQERKTKILHKIGDRKSEIPGNGEIAEVAISGNISNGAYGRLPEPEELKQVDDFMQQFVFDLENRLGSSLNTMCFDLGIKDDSIYKGEYNFQKMKESIVFYEFQIPFGINGYLDEFYNLNGRNLNTLRNNIKRFRLQIRLGKSIFKNLIQPASDEIL